MILSRLRFQYDFETRTIKFGTRTLRIRSSIAIITHASRVFFQFEKTTAYLDRARFVLSESFFFLQYLSAPFKIKLF